MSIFVIPQNLYVAAWNRFKYLPQLVISSWFKGTVSTLDTSACSGQLQTSLVFSAGALRGGDEATPASSIGQTLQGSFSARERAL